MNLKKLLTRFLPGKKEEEPTEELEEDPIEIPEDLPEYPDRVPKVENLVINPSGRTKARGHDKFTEEQRTFIATCVAHCLAPSEVAVAFEQQFQMKMTYPSQSVWTMKRSNKWKGFIEKMRKEYLADVNAVAGSHKRVRLERAERVYDRAVKKGDLKYSLLSIEQQRKEFDKHENNQFVILQQQYNFMSDDELQQRKQYLLGKLKNLKENSNGNEGHGGVQSEVG